MEKSKFPKQGAIAAGLTVMIISISIWFFARVTPIGDNSEGTEQVKLSSAAIANFVDSQLTRANTRFSFKLFSQILKRDSTKNVLVSPTSISIALAIAYNGASDETQQAMAKALELQGMDLNSLNQANAVLITALIQADPKVNISLANSLWAKQGVPFKPEFLQKTQTFYTAEANNLDFTNPKAPDTINNWVKHHTWGKISQIINEIPQDSELLLINAVYFKGRWTDKFDKGDTKNKSFTLVDGSIKQIPLMSRTGRYN